MSAITPNHKAFTAELLFSLTKVSYEAYRRFAQKVKQTFRLLGSRSSI
jgi:hypothetical protein